MNNRPSPYESITNDSGPRIGEKRALTIVSIAVLLCTSVWFSGTAAASHLEKIWNLSSGQAALLTTSVQLGFIFGTFLYAFFNIPDLFSSRKVFFVSACLGGIFNLIFAFASDSIESAFCLRFLTGITLAGIYPVGMKIVATWFQTGLGWHLSILIGALTLGKSSAYFLQVLSESLGWRGAVSLASGGSLLGGLLVITLLSDGPYLRKRATFSLRILVDVFRIGNFRKTAFGYFGHMWELYAFWALIGFYLSAKFQKTAMHDQVSLWTSLVIGIGVLGCLSGGYFSKWIGQRRIAVLSLAISGTLCLLSGWIFDLSPGWVLAGLLIWGFFVIADSAQFSALAARYCPPLYTGTALTVQNGIGFLITIISIQLVSHVAAIYGWRWAFLILAIGPFLGILSMLQLPTSADKDS